MTQLSERLNAASGWKTVFRHSYIDENGNYCHIALIRNEHGYKMSEKLRKERWENSEKLVEKIKEKTAKRKEDLQKVLEEKRAEKREEKGEKDTSRNKVKQLLEKNIADSGDGYVYIDNEDFRTIIEAINKEDSKGNNSSKSDEEKQMEVGTNIDLKI